MSWKIQDLAECMRRFWRQELAPVAAQLWQAAVMRSGLLTIIAVAVFCCWLVGVWLHERGQGTSQAEDGD